MRWSRTTRVLLASGTAVALLTGCGAPTLQPRTAPAGVTAGPEPEGAGTDGGPGTTAGQEPSSVAAGGGTPASRSRPPDRGGGGLASPIRIPLPTNTVSGFPFAEAVGRLKEKIAEACGGDQCVGIVRVGDDDPGNDTVEFCDRIDRVRGSGTGDTGDGDGLSEVVEVPRGGDLVVVVTVRCEDVRSTGGGTDGTDGQDGSGEDGAGGEDGADGEASDTSQAGTGSG